MADYVIHKTKIAQHIAAPLKNNRTTITVSMCREFFFAISRLAQAVLKANGLSEKLIGKGKLGLPVAP